jgi:hypothetical protein
MDRSDLTVLGGMHALAAVAVLGTVLVSDQAHTHLLSRLGKNGADGPDPPSTIV